MFLTFSQHLWPKKSESMITVYLWLQFTHVNFCRLTFSQQVNAVISKRDSGGGILKFFTSPDIESDWSVLRP